MKDLLGRSFFGALGLFLFYFTIKNMPLSTAVTLQYLSPVFATISCVWLIKEAIHRRQYLFFAVAFLGVIIIKGFDSNVSVLYFMLAIVSAFFSGLSIVFIRKLRHESPRLIVAAYSIFLLVVSALLCLFSWVTPTLEELIYLVLIGVVTYIAQYYMTLSFQVSKVNRVAPVKYIGIVFSAFFGFIMFSERLSFMIILGISLILIGITANAIYRSK